MPFTSRTVALPSGPVTYWEAGTGRPLLYLHAAGGHQVTAPLLALAETRRVLAPVFPGFDGTPFHPGIDTMEKLGNLAETIADSAHVIQVDQPERFLALVEPFLAARAG